MVDTLEDLIENNRVPHCILASGPSGCGKTTTFRILAKLLNCNMKLDFKEVNAAEKRGIEMARSVQRDMWQSAIGECRIYLFDECHQLTKAAQESLLIALEDTPSHVYFFLASTDPQKLLKTIKTRSTHLKFRALTDEELSALIKETFNKEKKEELPKEVVSKIVELSDGSARAAMVMLHQVVDMDMSEEDLVVDRLQSKTAEKQAIDICRALMRPKINWPEMAGLLKEVDQDAEEIRWIVLGYMKSVALGANRNSTRACIIIDHFRDNFYDSKMAGLVVSCYNAIESFRN